MPSDTYRFVEVPPSPLTRSLVIARSVIMPLIIGSVAAFGVGLIFLLVFDENAVQLPRSWDQFDGLGRNFLGFSMLLGGFGLGLLPEPLWVAIAFSTHRDLMRHAATSGTEGPAPPQAAVADARYRRLTALASWSTIAALTLVGVLVLTLFFLLDEAEALFYLLWSLGVCAALAAVFGLLWIRSVKKSGAQPHPPYLDEGRIEKAERAAATRHTQRTLRDDPGLARWAKREKLATWLLGIGAAGVVAAAVATFIPAFVRKPCRHCEPRYYSDPVEWLIDQGMLIGFVLIVASVACITASVVVTLSIEFPRKEHYRRLAKGDDADRSRPDEKIVTALLGGPSPLRVTCVALGFWVATVSWFSLSATLEGADGQAPFAGHDWGDLLYVSFVLFGVLVLLEVFAEHEQRVTAATVRSAWPSIEEVQVDEVTASAAVRRRRPRRR